MGQEKAIDGLDPLADQRIFQDVMLRELNEEQRMLLSQVLRFDCGYTLLQFMHEHPRELLTADDIAFHLKAPPTCVESTLHALMGVGMTEQREIAGLSFFGFAGYAVRRQLASDFVIGIKSGKLAWADLSLLGRRTGL